jgi:hypothetical protein
MLKLLDTIFALKRATQAAKAVFCVSGLLISWYVHEVTRGGAAR